MLNIKLARLKNLSTFWSDLYYFEEFIVIIKRNVFQDMQADTQTHTDSHILSYNFNVNKNFVVLWILKHEYAGHTHYDKGT